jgi:hypothetical protein
MSLEKMRVPPRKVVGFYISGFIAFLGIGWLTVYILSGVSDAITLNGPHLLDLRKEWLRDGSPEPPPVKRYVAKWTDPERYFLCTNSYVLGDRTVRSLFGMADAKFEDKGILVVSRDGELIWVPSSGTPEPVKRRR